MDALPTTVRWARRPWSGRDMEALMPRFEDAWPSSDQEIPSEHRLDRDDSPRVGAVLRRAREHLELSLREVERRIGRSNAYLSQVERGLIKRPDPVVLLELAELYALNFELLAEWAGWAGPNDRVADDATPGDSTTALIRKVLELDDEQRTKAFSLIEDLLREGRT